MSIAAFPKSDAYLDDIAKNAGKIKKLAGECAAAELEFLYLLIFREAEAVSNGERESAAAIAALRRRFLSEHLAAWFDPFTSAVKDGAKSPFYRELAELTRQVVEAESAAGGA